jgi:sodium-dependent dicarboxylate transporter 2/3/5
MFSTGRFPIKVMAREGLVLNLLGAVVVTVVCVTFL